MPAASAPLAPARGTDKAAVSPNAAELPANAPADWWGAARKELAEREYFVSPAKAEVGKGLQAPNRVQNFRISFTPEGVRVAPRETGKPGMAAWDWTLKLKAWGDRNEIVPASPLAPTAKGNRVEYRRDGIVEWYVNTPKGLEQGFTVERAPTTGGEIVVEVAAGGSLAGKVKEDGTEMSFADRAGTRIRFGSLAAVDAAGKALPAKFEAREGGYALVVAAKDAVYPVVIDPIATIPSIILEANGRAARFGYSVASAGDVNGDGYDDVIVGAPFYDNGQSDEGAAFVFLGAVSGLVPTPAWTEESDQAGAQFGSSVASAGDVNSDGYSDVIVGVLNYDNGQTNEGAALIFMGSSAGLSAAPAWMVESDQAGAQFGSAVASAGDVNGDGYGDVIIGAANYTNVQTGEGAAFVYLGSSEGISTTPAWSAESDQESARFGNSVASAGDVNADGYGDVIVGAYLYDNAEINEGRAFVYLGSAAGLSLTPVWTAESDQAGAYFGNSVASAGDVNGDGYGDVIVGAYWYDSGMGKAFLYRGSASGLDTAPAWEARGVLGWDTPNFGSSVASAGDVNGDGYSDVIIGADNWGYGLTDEGNIYLYTGSGAGLTENFVWKAGAGRAYSDLGTSVASAGDVNGDGYDDLIAGADFYSNGEFEEGVAMVFLGSSVGPRPAPDWKVDSDLDYANFGDVVSSAGDVNGDSYSDVLVGNSSHGEALLFLGTAVGLKATPDWTAKFEKTGFGSLKIAAAGDVNNDGYCDVIVGTGGRAFLYLGAASGLSLAPAWTAESDQSTAAFGSSVASAGDVNGDGFSDVIVGANNYSNGQIAEGKAFLYMGSASGLSTVPAWTAESDWNGARFGITVASAGDVNGDGYDDVVVAAVEHDLAEEGIVLLYLGSASGLAATPAWTAESNQARAFYGQYVASAGDVNGDGYGDLIIGATGYDDGQTDEGKAFLYLGSADGPSALPAWTAESDYVSANFGVVASAGDFNGDGYGDVIVGAPRYAQNGSAGGWIFIYMGSAGGLSALPGWSAETNQESYLGWCVASAGDVNGDGYSDVVAGAPYFDDGQTNEGAVFAYMGPPLSLEDADHDGYSPSRGDCTDEDPTIHPGVQETPGDGIDQDCNGHDAVICHVDADRDGYGGPVTVFGRDGACDTAQAEAGNPDDCDDKDPLLNPGMAELCNGIDDDCDRIIDDGLSATTFYVDDDGDTYGDASDSIQACAAPPRYVADGTDCEDSDASIHPGAPELCNGVDDECNGVIDNGLPVLTFYVDIDGDTYGDAAETIQACSVPRGYAVTSDDCNDSDASIHPSAVETPDDGVDQDCNGSDAKSCYRDLDRDGYGSKVVVPAGDGTCDTAQSESDNSTDCNDADTAINPGVVGIAYDGIDQNCDGVDEVLGNAYEPGGNGGCFLRTLSF